MPYLYGKDLIEVLKKKHATGTYKEMVKSAINIFYIYALEMVPFPIQNYLSFLFLVLYAGPLH